MTTRTCCTAGCDEEAQKYRLFCEEHGPDGVNGSDYVVGPHDVVYFPCTHCNAKPGEPCRTEIGKETAAHTFRWNAALGRVPVAAIQRLFEIPNVCEHGDHEAPEGKRFCSKRCEECEHTEFDENKGTCANVCGGNTEIIRKELSEKIEELHTHQWWANHGDGNTRVAMAQSLPNAKKDLADWLLRNRRGLLELLGGS